MYVYNPFGMALEEFGREMTHSRIGKRIHAIRLEEDMSRGDLGEKVGLDASRIQQYEIGRRKPKFELLKKIAEALGVEASALLDPQVSSYIGAMFAFFEMETLFDLRLKEVDGQMCICFGESQNDVKPLMTEVTSFQHTLKRVHALFRRADCLSAMRHGLSRHAALSRKRRIHVKEGR